MFFLYVVLGCCGYFVFVCVLFFICYCVVLLNVKVFVYVCGEKVIFVRVEGDFGDVRVVVV